MAETAQTFESWAVVELFGHQRIAGRVTEQQVAGTNFLRVDVPELPAREARGFMSAQPALPAYTRLFGAGAIYAINPVSEAVALHAALEFRARPVITFDLDAPGAPLLTGGSASGLTTCDMDEDD